MSEHKQKQPTAADYYEMAWEGCRGDTLTHIRARAALAQLAELAGVDTRRRPYEHPRYDRPKDHVEPSDGPMTVSPETYDRLEEMVRHPPAPTPALRWLFRQGRHASG